MVDAPASRLPEVSLTLPQKFAVVGRRHRITSGFTHWCTPHGLLVRNRLSLSLVAATSLTGARLLIIVNSW